MGATSVGLTRNSLGDVVTFSGALELSMTVAQ